MQRKARPAVPTRRAWAWLPDAELDAHPLGSWLLEMGFDLWIRALYRRVVLFPDDFHIAPGTLIACNHQRDVDGPMLGTVLVRRSGSHFQWPLPFFATREDLFRPGILSRLTVHWPRPLSALLGHIPLAWFFPLGRAEPMRRVREFTFGETLRALVDAGLGDADAASVLNARGRREARITAGAVSVRAAGERRDLPLEAWWGLRRLTLPALEKLTPTFRATIAAQLERFAHRLDRGRCVYFAPEGTISMDGRFGRIRAGFFRLAHMAESPPWIQPMALAYDTLASGRSRVVVRIGERFRADATLDRRAFDVALRRSVLQLAPVTPSHLLARWLLHGPRTFTRDELAGWMARCCTTLRVAHPSLDPLFTRKSVTDIAAARLRWMKRKNLVVRRGGSFENACARDATPGWRTPAGIAVYLDNNLADLVPGVDRILPC
ncbi:MAG: 1-acyl-sn-glycerol-3-phosphate acyltransferase [Xanthomonadaceae bacterium]|nr:1-acyl-sn-glycerol-3-phosphate acyltransferase [Xanthomonadaceae bacterium]